MDIILLHKWEQNIVDKCVLCLYESQEKEMPLPLTNQNKSYAVEKVMHVWEF